MDTLFVFEQDTLDLCGHDFYYSHRTVNEVFDMYKTHAHNHYELYFLINGERNYFIGNGIVHVQAGDVVFVPKHIIHKTTSVSSSGHERFLINFTDKYFDESLKNEILKIFKNYYLSIPEKYLKKAEDIFFRISEEYKSMDKYSPILLKSYLTEFFALLIRSDTTSVLVNESENKTEKHIKKVLDAINNDMSAEMTVDIAANIAGFSKSYFEKSFRQLTGFTFIDYLNTMRLLHAQKLLSETKKSVTDIAFECGFNSSNYFTTVFKKFTGTTPLKFRKKENCNNGF